MTLEQRLEVVEAELVAMKTRGGYEFVVDDGKVFIQDAKITGEIKTAQNQAAKYEAGMTLTVT